MTLHYTSQYAQIELRGDVTWIVRGGYQVWNDLPYAGVGGADIATLWSPEIELGNAIHAPYAMVAGARPVGEGWRTYGQLYLHPAQVDAAPGGLLDQERPFGSDGGVYGDLTVGAELDTTDRWPLPDRGARAEVDVRAGATLTDGALSPLAGAHAELVRWWPATEGVVIGVRGVAEHSVGPRPMWEEGVTGGRWRDELGFEQVLSGYGRIRTRGDGLLAAELEVRPRLFHAELPWFTVDAYASLFAEEAWLFDGWDPGPPLPTIGFGPELLYQRASQLRPFVAWGWRTDEVGGPRRPVPQFGLSVMDPL
ncbi:MAG: hypothetical protein H6738_14375 [Alphaproteobacteria bacterium]|nr:hypothetical protein [Alphaproteobacteria bacterium]MCB9697961.1 hypothetical protein [Alphaproteobacteria bacterium]